MWPWVFGVGAFLGLLIVWTRRQTVEQYFPGLVPAVMLFVLFLAAIVPCFGPTALYTPQILAYPNGVVSLTASSMASVLLALGTLRALRSMDPGVHLWPRACAFVGLTLVFVGLVAAAGVYAKFGFYPGPSVLRDFAEAPYAFFSYVKSGTSVSDVLLSACTTVMGGTLSFAVVRLVWGERRSPWVAIGTLVLGVVIVTVSRYYPSFLATEHSLPSTRYTAAATTVFDDNRIEAARPYLPRPTSDPPSAPLPRARHVLLIIAECLRADHLPAYGYARDTTPFIQADSPNWQVFTRMYSHGSRTSDSFPVLFNSQYFAAIDHTNQGATTLWRDLRSGGVQSAFLSAGAMEWGGITHAVDMSDVDFTLMASSVPDALRRDVTSMRFDYAVDDSIPLARYVDLLSGALQSKSSFVTLHLVGSHYPFGYNDAPDVFVPSLRHPAATRNAIRPSVLAPFADGEREVAGSTIELTANSYDNSIIHIDGLVRKAVEVLRDRQLLDDSVILLTADHGESLGEHRTFFHGTTLYDEQVHVPFLIRVGSNLQVLRDRFESSRTHVTGQVDVVPTVAQLLLGGPSLRAPFEGVSLLSEHQKPYELLLFRGIGEKIAIVTNTAKYIFDIPGRRGEKYASDADPEELRNLWPPADLSLPQFFAQLEQSGVVSKTADAQAQGASGH